MSRARLRAARTETDNLVSNLRGEVGEIITSWVAMRFLMMEARPLESGDPAKDLSNERLALLHVLLDRLEDDIVSRLSELGETDVGRLNFHFAARKFPQFKSSAEAFARFVRQEKLRDKRNRAISHKELPETWSERRYIHIPYRVLLQAIAIAVRLMKRIDRVFLGPAAPYLWREARKRRYLPTAPGKVAYMLLPYLRLSNRDRSTVIDAELREGRGTWIPMKTKINGQNVTVPVYREWGGILLGNRLLLTPEYPVTSVSEISVLPQSKEGTEAAVSEGEPG